jgi:hypothetical protein
MNEIFKVIGDLGFPVAMALAGGYFVYLTIKLLLAGVLGSIRGMAGIITALDNRVKTMNNDVVRIDTIVSNALGLKPDVDRIARADGKSDARRD